MNQNIIESDAYCKPELCTPFFNMEVFKQLGLAQAQFDHFVAVSGQVDAPTQSRLTTTTQSAYDGAIGLGNSQPMNVWKQSVELLQPFYAARDPSYNAHRRSCQPTSMDHITVASSQSYHHSPGSTPSNHVPSTNSTSVGNESGK